MFTVAVFWSMHGQACPSTQTLIRPQLKNTNWNYTVTILLLIVSEIHCILRLCIKKVEFFIKRQFKIISFESYKNTVPQFEPNWIEDKNFVYDTAFLWCPFFWLSGRVKTRIVLTSFKDSEGLVCLWESFIVFSHHTTSYTFE